MFDVNLNDMERDFICALLQWEDAAARDAEIVKTIDKLLEMRYNRGKRQGVAMFRDTVVDAIVHELKR